MKNSIREASKKFKTRGYRILVDNEQIYFSRYTKKMECELDSIRSDSPPRIYRNLLGELAINYE